ncbi:MAG: metallophosphoesterase [Egibacteraceae bacterium]
MAVTDHPLRIAQLGDIHCGTPTFEASLLEQAVERINALRPDAVAVVGDLTAAGYGEEFAEAAGWIGRLEAPVVVVPGNHDARNLGNVHFERHFGARFSALRLPLSPERAERIRAGGLTVVAVDSSQADVNQGEVGAPHYDWIRDQFHHADDLKVFVLHHHLVSIPGTGRERNTIADAGELLELLTDLGVDLVLSGHKHVPFFWALNGLLVCNSGTAATRRLRGLTPPSWNEIQVDASTIKVFMHYETGHRSLSVIRSRTTRELIREAFYLTEAFRVSNPVA